jgi:hypothetical protein
VGDKSPEEEVLELGNVEQVALRNIIRSKVIKMSVSS